MMRQMAGCSATYIDTHNTAASAAALPFPPYHYAVLSFSVVMDAYATFSIKQTFLKEQKVAHVIFLAAKKRWE
jgi:hypothetical protein